MYLLLLFSRIVVPLQSDLCLKVEETLRVFQVKKRLFLPNNYGTYRYCCELGILLYEQKVTGNNKDSPFNVI